MVNKVYLAPLASRDKRVGQENKDLRVWMASLAKKDHRETRSVSYMSFINNIKIYN